MLTPSSPSPTSVDTPSSSLSYYLPEVQLTDSEEGLHPSVGLTPYHQPSPGASLGGTTLVTTLSLARQSLGTASTHMSAAWMPQELQEAPKVDVINNIIATLINLVPIIKVVKLHPLNP
jgi:hypothetical protein